MLLYYEQKIMHKSKKGQRHLTCMGCLPIEAVCFVYGIVSCVLSVFGIVIVTLARLFVPIVPYDHIIAQFPDEAYKMFEDMSGVVTKGLGPPTLGLYDSLPLTPYALILYVCYLGSLVFSVLLCYGTHKRSPGFLKVYLVYGVSVTALMLLSLFYLYTWLYDTVGFSVVVTACCIYSLVLRVVHRTHQMFHTERNCRLAELRGYME